MFNNDYNPDKWVTYLINLGIYLPMLLVNIWGIKWFGRIDTVVTVVQVFGIFAFLVVRPRHLSQKRSHPVTRFHGLTPCIGDAVQGPPSCFRIQCFC